MKSNVSWVELVFSQDGDASLETMSINNINSPGNSMMSLMSGTKPKTPPGKTQLVSPSLTTAKSLELTKAEFVENTFESSDDEDHLPALPVSSVLPEFPSSEMYKYKRRSGTAKFVTNFKRSG